MNNKSSKTNQEILQNENSRGDQNKEKRSNNNDLTKQQIISKAFHYHSKGNIIEAAKYYNHFIKRGFNDPSVYSNFGVICIQLGKNDLAINLYQRSISIYPNNPEAYSNLGNLYKELGKDREAEKLLRKAISINADFADAYSNLGTLLLNRGEINEAENFIHKAIKLNPDSFKDHSNLGIILKNKGKYKEAEVSTIKAIKLNPSFTTAYNNLCSILISLDKLNEAELSVKKAIDLDPNMAISYHNLGIIQTKKNDYDKAELSIRRAIELNPNYALAHNDLGVILSKLKKPNEAENSIRTALKIDPNLAIAYSNLSEILIGIGRTEEAEECVKKALKLDNKIGSAYYNLACISKGKDQLDLACLNIQKAMSIEPNNNTYKCLWISLLAIYKPEMESNDIIIKINNEMNRVDLNYNQNEEIKDIEIKKFYNECEKIYKKYNLNINSESTQIYNNTGIPDNNCSRHMYIFYKYNIIPKHCFSCYKVQIKLRTIVELIKLFIIFNDIKLPNNNSRKCMIELRPFCKGYYKGFIYCSELEEAKDISSYITEIIRTTIKNKVSIQIKRGCSEYALKYPQYKELDISKKNIMNYENQWTSIEKKSDEKNNDWLKANNSSKVFNLDSYLTIKNWISYAQKIGDESAKIITKDKINSAFNIPDYYEKIYK